MITAQISAMHPMIPHTKRRRCAWLPRRRRDRERCLRRSFNRPVDAVSFPSIDDSRAPSRAGAGTIASDGSFRAACDSAACGPREVSAGTGSLGSNPPLGTGVAEIGFS